jgi:hypothetical protein
MPVHRFRSVSDMPGIERVDGPDLIDRIRVLWNRAFALAPPNFPRGVTRFANLDDANRARFDLLVARMRATSSSARPDAEGGGRARGKPAASEQPHTTATEPHGGGDGGSSSAG